MSKDDPAKAERLAQALRANLRRRKAQSREQDEGPAPADGPKAAPSRP